MALTNLYSLQLVDPIALAESIFFGPRIAKPLEERNHVEYVKQTSDLGMMKEMRTNSVFQTRLIILPKF